MTRVTGMTRVVIDSIQSQFKAFTMETRVKSSFFQNLDSSQGTENATRVD